MITHPLIVTITRRVSILPLLLLGLCTSQIVEAAVSARTDRTQLTPGESVELQIRRDDDSASVQPNIEPLQADFGIVSSGQRHEQSFVNGQMSQATTWVLTLVPKVEGEVVIPAISVGDELTEPLDIEISDSPTSSSLDENTGVLIESSVDRMSGYVQGEFTYTVKILDGVGVTSVAIAPPLVDGASVTQHGQDRQSDQVVNGHQYRVIERDYLIRPQKSGIFEIPPVTAQVRVKDSTTGNSRSERFSMPGFPGAIGRSGFSSSMFDQLMNPGRTLTLRSSPLTLEVLAKPDGNTGWFLPAKAVRLQESWRPEQGEFRQGEAITRTVTLTAAGATSDQLPPVSIDSVDGMRVYQDSTRDRTVPTPDGMASVRETVFTLIPTRAGTFSLPEIRVDW